MSTPVALLSRKFLASSSPHFKTIDFRNSLHHTSVWTSYSSVFAQKSVVRPTSVRVRASLRLSVGEKKCIDRAFPPGSHSDHRDRRLTSNMNSSALRSQ